MKQLITDAIAVRPGVDEVKSFAKIIEERNSSGLHGSGGVQASSTTKGGKTKGGHDSSGDELTGEALIKNTFMANGSTSEFSKGDKIRVIAGDLNGISGKVVSMEIDTGFINFIPIGIEGFTNELRLEVKNVVKYFEPGDYVRVIDGKYRGETGLVISSTTTDEGVVFSNIALTQSHREIKVRANNLKIKTEIEQNAAHGNSAYFMDKAKPAPYTAGDLISYDNNKHVGVVLSVDSMGGPGSDSIRLISEDGSVTIIRGNQVSKRFDQRDLKTKQQSVDAKRNTIYHNNVVKIINGVYQGRKGVIKYLHKDVVFLWDKAFQQTNGLFVEKTRNVEILGTEHMNP